MRGFDELDIESDVHAHHNVSLNHVSERHWPTNHKGGADCLQAILRKRRRSQTALLMR